MKTETSIDQRVQDYFADAQSYAGAYYGTTPTAHFFMTRLQKVLELIGDVRGKRVLDAGCGPGILGSYLVDENYAYFGLDLSKEMINEAHNRIGSSAPHHLLRARIQMLPFIDSSFDIILCLGAIEYVEDADVVVRELSRVGGENGTVVISMLNKSSPYRFWYHYVYKGKLFNLARKILKRPIFDEPDLQSCTESGFLDLLNRNNLEVQDLVHYGYNLWLAPFDKYFPRLAFLTARKLDSLDKTRLRGLGDGFIVKAKVQRTRYPGEVG
jgi:ubiquinone/menaquinone biosynthesis C-methylase UbiE